jgi:hypothetical protein
MTAPLLELDANNKLDACQYCMCWLLTRVLTPKLREKVPTTVFPHAAGDARTAQPQGTIPNREPQPTWLLITAAFQYISPQSDDQIQPISQVPPEGFVSWLNALSALAAADQRNSPYDYSPRDDDPLSAKTTERLRLGGLRQRFGLWASSPGNGRVVSANSDPAACAT